MSNLQHGLRELTTSIQTVNMANWSLEGFKRCFYPHSMVFKIHDDPNGQTVDASWLYQPTDKTFQTKHKFPYDRPVDYIKEYFKIRSRLRATIEIKPAVHCQPSWISTAQAVLQELPVLLAGHPAKLLTLKVRRGQPCVYKLLAADLVESITLLDSPDYALATSIKDAQVRGRVALCFKAEFNSSATMERSMRELTRFDEIDLKFVKAERLEAVLSAFPPQQALRSLELVPRGLYSGSIPDISHLIHRDTYVSANIPFHAQQTRLKSLETSLDAFNGEQADFDPSYGIEQLTIRFARNTSMPLGSKLLRRCKQCTFLQAPQYIALDIYPDIEYVSLVRSPSRPGAVALAHHFPGACIIKQKTFGVVLYYVQQELTVGRCRHLYHANQNGMKELVHLLLAMAVIGLTVPEPVWPSLSKAVVIGHKMMNRYF
eukprot:TRINITY_DN2264_c0_g1_i1.p1 TRINITY_DN2264_c0_g1~~TRINITY_DN2264_c0_g1_i1.p1  ORF type:complete len:430 (+),score=48.56 TRINITY_DN2264_c0_g1_i1:90-1379(+)